MRKKVIVSLALRLCLLCLAARSNSFDFSTPSFLENSVKLNQATAVSLFRGKIVSLLNSLSARRHCRFLSEVSGKIRLNISSTQQLLNRINQNKLGVKKTKRRTCRQWNTKVTQFRKLFHTSEPKGHQNKTQRMRVIYEELPKLYNNLPLPFQCEMLLEVGRLSVMPGFDLSENSVNSVTKMNLYEVGNIIKKSEKVISNEVSMVRVANRCTKVLAGEKYRTTDVVVAVDIGNQQLQSWKRNLRDKMPWICGKFALDNGIKVENLHNFTVKKNLPFSAYFTHILNATTVGSKHEVKFHMHLLQANSMALEARFVLASLNAVPKKDLRMILRVNEIKYWAVDHYIGTAIQSVHSYNLKMLFPTYLRAFFNLALQRHERCLIIHLMSKYSNSSTAKITAFLRRKRVDVHFPCSVVNGVMSVVLSSKRNRENEIKVAKVGTPPSKTINPTVVVQPFWHVHDKEKKDKTAPIKQTIIFERKATMVEMVMFVLLGAIALVLVIFTITCVLFIVRKRRFRKKQRDELAAKTEQGRPENLTIMVDAAKLCDEELQVELDMLKWKAERLSRPIFWSQSSDDRREPNTGDNLIGVPLEPLRISTDDDDSRYGDEETSARLLPQNERTGIYFIGSERDLPARHVALCHGKNRNGSCGGSDVFLSENDHASSTSENITRQSLESNNIEGIDNSSKLSNNEETQDPEAVNRSNGEITESSIDLQEIVKSSSDPPKRLENGSFKSDRCNIVKSGENCESIWKRRSKYSSSHGMERISEHSNISDCSADSEKSHNRNASLSVHARSLFYRTRGLARDHWSTEKRTAAGTVSRDANAELPIVTKSPELQR